MKQLLTGNEAIARGAWEAGIRFASAYPGTPSTEILENMGGYKEVISEWAPNEKVALEAAIGASFAGGRAMACMKHVGLNVAADPMFTAAYTGVTGGLVIVTADDPGCHSSQNEQDNRYYARSARLGMFEPADSQECKDFMAEAFKVSEAFDIPILMRMTTRVCHSKSLVELGGRTEKPVPAYQHNIKFNPVPAVAKKRHVVVENNILRLKEYSEQSPLNREIWGSKKIGIISSGAAYQYAREVYGDDASYLKIGFSYPLPIEKIKAFAAQVEKLYVVEELEPVMETEIKAAGVACEGKSLISRLDELNPDIVMEALTGKKNETISYDDSIVANRPPVMCAGCPHRGFYTALTKIKDTIIVSDIGCYALGPKDIALCMGGGFSVAHGAQKIFSQSGQQKRVIGIMGDSTFFHSGMTSMLECVYNKSKVLLVVMDNRITGMTGHQENPGSGYTLSGDATSTTDVAEVAKALGVKHILTVNPTDLEETRKGIEWGLSFDEPALLITRWPCVLKKLSAEDKEEFGNYKKINVIDPEKCIGCRACIRTGCPALEFHADVRKVSIDRAQCVGCDVCVQVCPAGAISAEVK